MATRNKLDASGLLYEGSDFAKWKNDLRSIFAQHFPSISWSRNCICPLLPHDLRSDVSDSIWWRVSPYIRARVPEKDRKIPRQLLLALRTTARPFRFMELPAEIRLRVYKFELAEKTSPQTLRLLKRGPGLPPPKTQHYHSSSLVEPQILSTSRQIRMEALLLYYTKTSVNLMFNDRVFVRGLLLSLRDMDRLRQAPCDVSLQYRSTNAERVNAMHKWASTIMPDSMRSLRRISVQLPLLAICSRKGCEDMLHISLSIVNGGPKLSITAHTWLTPGSQKLLSDHADTVSNVARTLKLEGEALIMVLISRPDIWDQLELADD